MNEIKIDCISNKTIKKIRNRILGKNKTIKQTVRMNSLLLFVSNYFVFWLSV